MGECALHDKVSFHGKYDDRECGITFTAAEEDTGVWKCEIEEYVTWRSRGAGRVQTAQMNVTVQASTTEATTDTTTETVSTESTVSTVSKVSTVSTAVKAVSTKEVTATPS